MAEPRIEIHMTGGGDVDMEGNDTGEASGDVEAGENANSGASEETAQNTEPGDKATPLNTKRESKFLAYVKFLPSIIAICPSMGAFSHHETDHWYSTAS